MRDRVLNIVAAALTTLGFALSVVGFFLLVAFVMTAALGCGSNIPIDPACEDLFTHQDEEAASYDCERAVCDEEGAYNEGYSDGQATCDVCEDCACLEPPTCPEPPSCDAYGDDVPRGHLPKECRGHRHDDEDSDSDEHSALRCDPNCDPNDPICIPCDLEEYAGTCYTQCVPTGNGGTICRTYCRSYA